MKSIVMTKSTAIPVLLAIFAVLLILVQPLYASSDWMDGSGVFSGEETPPCDDEDGECEYDHKTTTSALDVTANPTSMTDSQNTKPSPDFIEHPERDDLPTKITKPRNKKVMLTSRQKKAFQTPAASSIDESDIESSQRKDPAPTKQPRFGGDSYMVFPRLPSSARASLELSITFKAGSGDGLLLYSGRHDRRDFISLGLRDRHVEFRFNCGGDTATLTTKQNITLNQWHKVVVFLDKRDGYLMLDHGDLVMQSTHGPQYLMDLQTNLYLGGIPSMRTIAHAVQYDSGFSGCVKDVVINGRKLELSHSAGGETLKSHKIGECGGKTFAAGCQCRHQAPCQYTEQGEMKCACPLGTYGQRCEYEFQLVMPSFSGHSYLSYPSLGKSASKSFTITLVLKPRSDTGLILFNSQRPDGKGDFISLSLREGRVEFIFDCGSGPAIIRSETPITLNQWQTIKISRDGRTGSLALNGGLPVEGTSPGRLSMISVGEELQLGGMNDYRQLPGVVDMRTGFTGCIQQVAVNSKTLSLPSALSGVNIVNCNHMCVTHSLCFNGGTCHAMMDHYKCRCALGYTGVMCGRARRISTPSFSGDGYLQFTDEKITQRVSGFNTKIELKLRTTERRGLVLLAKQNQAERGDHISIRIIDGKIEARYDLGTGVETVIKSKKSVDDGSWHYVKFVRKTLSAYLKVDEEVKVSAAKKSRFLQLNSDVLFIGGTPITDIRHQSTGFDGCIKDILISGYNVDVTSDVSAGANIRPCMEY